MAGKRRKKQKNRILRLFMLVFIIYAGYIFTMQQFDIVRFHKIDAETKARSESLKYTNTRLTEQLNVTNSKKFIEKMAREKLGLVKPGEIVYINQNESKQLEYIVEGDYHQMPLEEGKIYDGIVSSIAPFGAFIQLPEGKTGLVHISEIADSYVKDIKEHIKEKQNVKVKILNIGQDGKINLSIRQAKDPKTVPKPAEVNWAVEVKKQVVGNFEDKLSRFLKDSEENIISVKRQEGNRRGNNHRKK